MAAIIADTFEEAEQYALNNLGWSRIQRSDVWTCEAEIRGKRIRGNDTLVILTRDPIKLAMIPGCLGKYHAWMLPYVTAMIKQTPRVTTIPGGWNEGDYCYFSHPEKHGLLGCRVVGMIKSYDETSGKITLVYREREFVQTHTREFGGISGVNENKVQEYLSSL